MQKVLGGSLRFGTDGGGHMDGVIVVGLIHVCLLRQFDPIWHNEIGKHYASGDWMAARAPRSGPVAIILREQSGTMSRCPA
jgi:hypothetical protein